MADYCRTDRKFENMCKTGCNFGYQISKTAQLLGLPLRDPLLKGLCPLTSIRVSVPESRWGLGRPSLFKILDPALLRPVHITATGLNSTQLNWLVSEQAVSLASAVLFFCRQADTSVVHSRTDRLRSEQPCTAAAATALSRCEAVAAAAAAVASASTVDFFFHRQVGNNCFFRTAF